MAPPRRSVRLARELAFSNTNPLSDRHVNRHVLRHLCQIADDKMTSGDRDCLRVARLCCRIGGQLKTQDARALSFASLASALRQAGRLDHAWKALKVGLAAAPADLKGELLRRRTYLHIFQGRFAKAVEDAEEAVQLADRSEYARALGTLGIALAHNGDQRGAIREHARCLEHTSPDSPIPYNNALHNYATSLAQGTPEEAEQAMELCAELRDRLKARHKMQRAKLWWTEGLLHEKLADTEAAWWKLNTAWRSLVMLETAPEVAAIVADMARVSNKPPAVRSICNESAPVITSVQTLREPLAILALAARETIPEAAAALRQAACQLAPCPAV